MPNWAGQETGGERMGRWMASPCADKCTAPVEFRLTVGAQPDWEGFACEAHLALAVRAVNFRGRMAEVEYFGPVSSNSRARVVLEALEDAETEDDAERKEELDYFAERLSNALERTDDESLTDRTRAKWRKRVDILAYEASKRVYVTTEAP